MRRNEIERRTSLLDERAVPLSKKIYVRFSRLKLKASVES